MHQVKSLKNLSGLFPEKSYAPNENVKKLSGDLDDIKNPLVTTIDTVYKDGTIDRVDKGRKSKPNVVEEAITSPISEKKKIDTFNKKRNHKH